MGRVPRWFTRCTVEGCSVGRTSCSVEGCTYTFGASASVLLSANTLHILTSQLSQQAYTIYPRNTVPSCFPRPVPLLFYVTQPPRAPQGLPFTQHNSPRPSSHATQLATASRKSPHHFRSAQSPEPPQIRKIPWFPDPPQVRKIPWFPEPPQIRKIPWFKRLTTRHLQVKPS